MQTILERIKKGQYWKFHGGIHPPEQKFLTNDKPIKKSAIPERLIIPVQQHIGLPGDILVKPGDKVLKGQPLTHPSLPMMVPVHASTSGEITKIEPHMIAHPSGLSELCIFLKPDGLDTWRSKQVCQDYTTLSHTEIINKIANAGISGMGGAGFPTHIKVDTKAQIEFLIINAAECEPYITADDLLIREHSEKIVEGIKILKQVLAPQHILIGIEDNKPEAIAILTKVVSSDDDIHVCTLPTKYPTGGEKQLIKVLTGKEIPSGNLPSSQGIIMQNIATCFAIAEAVVDDIPLIRRVISITGQALTKPQNIWAYIGTPVANLLSQFGYKPDMDKKSIIMGGPMMGFTLPSDQIPVVKFTNCILTPSKDELNVNQKEVECIRCGQCAEVCPSQLLPQELQWSAKANDHEQLQKLNLFDCIDCGACAYVCPSHIPLVHYYRIAKADIRQKQLMDIKAEKAKIRFEARKARLEQEKRQREEKQRKASEARKAAMNAKSSDGSSAQSAVAAALARVKAKKLQQGTEKTSTTSIDAENKSIRDETNDKKSQVSAAIARAKAKKSAKAAEQQKQPELAINSKEAQQDSIDASARSSNKSPAVARAIAKAKAKKLAEKKATESESKDNTAKSEDLSKALTDTPSNEEKDKKLKIAAAIKRAKAKKLAQQQSNDESSFKSQKTNTLVSNEIKTDGVVKVAKKSPSDESQEDKKAKVSAVIAKAKAQLKKEHENITPNETHSADEDKRMRIAAAVAKAKAKKQQRTESK